MSSPIVSRTLQSHEWPSETFAYRTKESLYWLLQSHEGVSETLVEHPFLALDCAASIPRASVCNQAACIVFPAPTVLQPHEGSSVTRCMPPRSPPIFMLQSHEATSVTSGTVWRPNSSCRFDPSRVRLKRVTDGRELVFEVKLQSHEGSSVT